MSPTYYVLHVPNAFLTVDELNLFVDFSSLNETFQFISGTVPMKSITKLLNDDCRRIVDENANKIGFPKAFEEMRISIISQTETLRYNTRSSRKRVHLSPEQLQMETLSEIYEAARTAKQQERHRKKQNDGIKSTKRDDKRILVVVERSCHINQEKSYAVSI